MQPHRLGILYCHLPKAADPGDCNPLSRPSLGLFDALVTGDAGAKARRHFGEIAPLRQSTDVGRRSDHVLGEAAIDAVTGVVLPGAKAVPPGPAIFALPAGVVQPRHSDRVSLFQAFDARS